MTEYRALTGLTYPDGNGGECRAEAGDVVSDLPADAVGWLVETGAVERVGPDPAKADIKKGRK